MADTVEPIEPIAPVAAKPVAAAPHVAHHAAAHASPPVDTADLSEAAQVSLLQEGGESVAEIASALGITVAEVNTDLGLISPSTPATPQPG